MQLVYTIPRRMFYHSRQKTPIILGKQRSAFVRRQVACGAKHGDREEVDLCRKNHLQPQARFSPMRSGSWKQPRQLSRTTLSCGRTLNHLNQDPAAKPLAQLLVEPRNTRKCERNRRISFRVFRVFRGFAITLHDSLRCGKGRGRVTPRAHSSWSYARFQRKISVMPLPSPSTLRMPGPVMRAVRFAAGTEVLSSAP